MNITIFLCKPRIFAYFDDFKSQSPFSPVIGGVLGAGLRVKFGVAVYICLRMASFENCGHKFCSRLCNV